MDFEGGISNPVGYGLKEDNNTSNVDTKNTNGVSTYGAIKNPASWQNKYNFIGKTMSLDGKLVDGINSAGVYMGGLFLPNITSYPLYNDKDSRKALGVFDIINYVLGTSSSVQEALSNLNKVQVVISTIRATELKNIVVPLHFYIADKTGNTAVIEFIAGKIKIYSTQNGLTDAPRVLTNSPDFTWQVKHYKEISKDFVPHNTDSKMGGMYMNGSGYLGLPGDSTPPSRFTKISTLLQASPVATNNNQANYVANMVRDGAAIVPIRFNAAPTLWANKYDLVNQTYQITNYITYALNGVFQVTPETSKYYHHSFNLSNIAQLEKDPLSIHSQLKAASIAVSESHAANILAKNITSPKASYKSKFSKIPTHAVHEHAYLAM